MDQYDYKVHALNSNTVRDETVRKNMGYTRLFSQRMDLIHMIPEQDVASSAYCIANKGTEYLVYLPEGPEIVVNLEDAPHSFQVEWFNPNTEERQKTKNINGGRKVSLTSPFGQTDAVVYLKAK